MYRKKCLTIAREKVQQVQLAQMDLTREWSPILDQCCPTTRLR